MAKTIALDEDFGDVTISVNGIRVEVRTDGSILAYTNGDVRVYPLANDDNQPAVSNAPEIGQLVEGKGIYAGTWEPKDRDGNSLGKTFNLFAAPEDLTDESGVKALLAFNNAVKRVAALKKWHGHDGGNFKNDYAVYQAVRDNPQALENWFIPTRDIVHGEDMNNYKVQADNLYAHKDKGAFKGTFTDQLGSGIANFYWSCTGRREGASHVYAVDFTDGVGGWDYKDSNSLSGRVVRAELRP